MKHHSLRALFATVLALSTMGYVAIDIYLPSLPSIERELATRGDLVQLTLTVYLLAFGLSHLIYGPLSDRYGRRIVVLTGLIASFIGTLLAIFAWGIYPLLIARALQGLFIGAAAAIARAVLRDTYEGDELARVGSFIPVGNASILALAPALGGYIQETIGWRGNFGFILLYSLVTLLMAIFWLPETNRHRNRRALYPKVLLHNYWKLLSSPIFMGYSLAAACGLGGLLAYFAVSPFLFERILGLTPSEYGWLALIIGAGVILGGYINSIAIPIIGRHKMLVIAVTFLALSGVLMLIPGLFGIFSIPSVMLPMFLYTFGMSGTFANTFAGAMQPFLKLAGSAGALYGCIQTLGGVAATLITAFLPDQSQVPLAIILLVVGILSYILQRIAYSSAHNQLI